MADYAQVRAAAAEVEEELGPMDVWVNDAFTNVFARFTDIDPEEFRRVTEVSYLGFVHGTRAALDYMLKRDHGAIVQVGSALAYRGIPLQSAYCGAKHAIQGFNQSLRCELLHDGSRVRVTMVQMPAVNTPQFGWVRSRLPQRAQPVPPIYEPEVAADAVVYAASHPQRREYRTGGSTALTLAANAVAPGVLDRYLARTGFSSQETGSPGPWTSPTTSNGRRTPPATSARTARSATRRTRAACSCGPPAPRGRRRGGRRGHRGPRLGHQRPPGEVTDAVPPDQRPARAPASAGPGTLRT